MVNPEISPAQIRAGRAWLRWSQEYLASRAGVSKRAVVRAESDGSLPHRATSKQLRAALEEAGLKFCFSQMVAIGVEMSRQEF